METITFGEIFSFISVSKIKVGEGKEQGKYPFYTSNTQVTLKTDKNQLIGPALIIGKKNSVSIHYCNSYFSAANDCIVAKLDQNCFINFNIQYIYYYLLNNPEILSKELQSKGTISIEFIQKLEIPQKDIDTQEKIVGILNKIEFIIQKRIFNLQRLSELKEKAFLNFFGDPVLDENKFKFIAPLDNVATIHGGGNYITETTPRETIDQLALLTQTAITKRQFDPKRNKRFIDIQPVNKHHRIQKGDVLFSRKNSLKLLGSTAYVFDTISNIVIPDTILRICCNPEKISGIYLTYLLNDNNFCKKLKNYSGGTLQTMPNIAIKNLKQFRIPYPELAAQQKFEKTILNIRQVEQNMTKQLSQIHQLMLTVANDLFAGKDIINIDLRLEILLNKINPESDNNDYSAFENNLLLKKLSQKISREEEIFLNINMYNRAKKVIFHLLKKGVITQEYDPKKNKMNIQTT